MLVIGGGLAGGLLALALAERGSTVELLSGQGPSATELSYGGVPWWAGPPGPVGALMATAPDCWQALERRHGPLGWRSCALLLHGPGGRLERHPYARLDGERFATALPAALERAGVRRISGAATGLLPRRSGGWTVGRVDAPSLSADQIALAAGAGNLALWPALAGRLLVSWAGVLHIEELPPATRLPWHGFPCNEPDGAIVMPLEGRRQALEAQALALSSEQWVVDGGLAPRGAGLLLGQTTLVRPGAGVGEPPAKAPLEAALREELNRLWPELAAQPARFLQAPVTFTTCGRPLVGPVAGSPGLWVFSGFSGPFALVPPLAPLLAAALGGDAGALSSLAAVTASP
ncbi:FAD-dependent oxidoreductase [Cyanobium sp. Morenito 9A2]|uniref:FAD-dependent oxidoreductase n=1 Tax=Cyanobium sp. Morenito 9A2 TaxID=2823718 RepID=UPI0020CCD802|nr:FAD-dependent oxidoreductase [Cyanobium sp. Morenito 9A2]